MKEWSVNLELDGRFTRDQAEDLIDRLGDRAAAAVSVSPTRLDVRFYVDAGAAHTAIERATKEIQKLLGEQAFTVASAEAQTPEELDRVLERSNFPDLLGVTEVANLLGVSRQRVDEIARTHENFPKPAVQLAAGPIWERAAIERFVEEWPRRAGRPPKAEQRHLGQIIVSPIHSFLQATKFMTALSQLPGIHSVKLQTYSRAKATIEIVSEGRPVGAIDYTRMGGFAIQVEQSSDTQVVLSLISGTGAPHAARR